MPHADFSTMTKYCPRCETPKDLSQFGHSYQTPDGYKGYCKECMYKASRASRAKRPEREVEYSRNWRKENPEAARNHSKKWRKKNPKALVLATQRYRSRKANAPGTFTAEEFEEVKRFQDYTCLRCGRREPEIKLTADHRIPLSRGGGNSISNIDALCGSCNSSKGNRIYKGEATYPKSGTPPESTGTNGL